MHTPHDQPPTRHAAVGGWLAALTAALLAACSTPMPPPPVAAPKAPAAPRPSAPAVSTPAPAPSAAVPLPPDAKFSGAMSAQDYRRDGARHIYAQNSSRIYKGKMPPLLQGVGVMQMDIDNRGQILSMSWLRAPSHAGAKAEIERTARAAAPYPVPQRLGRVTYTDTWLWHESGKFQLDTLTEGQSDR